MTDLRELYDEIIMDHNRNPRNLKAVEPATGHAEGNNPLCGDVVVVTLRQEGDVIADIGIQFPKKGCAISTASASLMTAAVKGKTVAEAERLFKAFHEMITAPDETPVDEKLGKLAALAGARKYASRTKCASLAWHALHAALAEPSKVVSTE